MKWIYLECGDAFNLSNIAHIWVQKCPSGFFLMGEMIHNQEEVALSHIFDTFKQCTDILCKLFIGNQPERSKREDVLKDCYICNAKFHPEDPNDFRDDVCRICMNSNDH